MLLFEKLKVLVTGGLALGVAPLLDCDGITVRAGAGSVSIGVPATVDTGWPPPVAALAEIADIPINPATAEITVTSARVRFKLSVSLISGYRTIGLSQLWLERLRGSSGGTLKGAPGQP